MQRGCFAHAARDERGATAIEYGVIMALIFLALVVGVGLLGTEVLGLNTYVADEVDNAID